MSAVRRTDGFTLIELVVCIVILGVLAVVAGPRFIEPQPFSERGYATEVAMALRAARNTAVASACDVQLTIDPVTGYQANLRALTGGVCDPSGAFTIAIQLSNGQLLANAPPSGVVSGPAMQVIFKADGSVAVPPPPFVVGPAPGTFTVTVNSAGFVR
jgi:MSHA pilin protein MshC